MHPRRQLKQSKSTAQQTQVSKRESYQPVVALVQPATTDNSLLLRIVFGTVSHNNLDLGPRKASIHHISAHILFWTTRHAHFQHNTPRQWLTQPAAQRSLCTAKKDALVSITSSYMPCARQQQVTRRRPNGFSQCSGACVANAVVRKVQFGDGPHSPCDLAQ